MHRQNLLHDVLSVCLLPFSRSSTLLYTSLSYFLSSSNFPLIVTHFVAISGRSFLWALDSSVDNRQLQWFQQWRTIILFLFPFDTISDIHRFIKIVSVARSPHVGLINSAFISFFFCYFAADINSVFCTWKEYAVRSSVSTVLPACGLDR